MPQVTVIIPAFNAGRTISAALQSVFSQSFRDYEVIVVDDGSTDDTPLQVALWRERLTYVYQPNRGPASARNEAIRHARGEYIAFLDADDVWLPRKLERQIAYVERFPETGFLHTATLVSRTPAVAVLQTTDELPLERVGNPPARAFCDLFHGRLDVNTVTVMVPRGVLRECGGFDDRRELQCEDWDLWLRIAARHPVGYLPCPLAVHRPGGAMNRTIESSFRGRQMIVQQSAALCHEGCEQHLAAPEECVRQREFQLQSLLGHERFWTGRLTDARAAFGTAIGLQPEALRARLYHAVTFVGQRWLDPVRRLRRAYHAVATPAAGATRNLTEDTPLRRARSAAVQVVHRLDDAVSAFGHEKRRILFEAASPLSVAVARPVLDILMRDPRVELWFTTSDGAWDPALVFGPAGITERVVPASSVRWMKFAAYINTDFWNMTWLPRRTRRIHLFHGVAGKYGLDAPTRIAPVVAAFDRLMFPNRDRLQRYADAGLVDPDGAAAALVGYPKVDCLVDGSLDRSAIGQRLGFDLSAPTVLYAPTWSPYSSLNKAGEAIIASLARRGGNVIVKLHDRSYDKSDRASGGIDWRTRLELVCRKHGVHLAQDYDAAPYLYVADALVTDHSSVGFEYMLLDRPLVVVDCPELIEKARINPQKVALLRSAAEVVAADDVAAGVGRGLSDRWRFSARRREVAAELFYSPGGATARAVQCVYGLLGLRAPARVPEASPASTIAVTPVLSGYEARTTYHA